MPLKIFFEVWSVPSELPHGVTHLNAFLIREYLKLHLVHQVTQQTQVLDIEPIDFPNPEDEGREAKPLDGTQLGPWEVEFRLVRLRDSLEPGTYDCSVEFAYPKNKTKRWYRKTAADWEQFGFWSGHIWSPTFQLEVLKEARRKREFVVPGQPRIEKGLDGLWRLTLKKDEASLVQLETRNGFYLGEEIMFDYLGGRMGSGLSDWRAENYVYEIPHGTRKLEFHARAFETANPPGHFWNPGGVSNGYKVLWEVKLATNLVLTAGSLK